MCLIGENMCESGFRVEVYDMIDNAIKQKNRKKIVKPFNSTMRNDLRAYDKALNNENN